MKPQEPQFISSDIPMQLTQDKFEVSVKDEIEYNDISFTETEVKVERSPLNETSETHPLVGLIDESLALSEREKISDEQNNLCNIEKRTTVEGNLVLREKNYQDILGTCEKLSVYLKRDNLHELQKEFRNIESCSVCSFVTKRNNIPVKYLALYKKSIQKCVYCGFQTKDLRAIRRHIRKIHKIKLIKCLRCSYQGETVAQLKHHRHEWHKRRRNITVVKRTFQCHVCNYQVHNKYRMTLHCNTVHRKLDETTCYKCRFCDFKTKYPKSLRNHEVTHDTTRKMYKCQLCPYQTPFLANLLKQHNITHETGEEARIYKCHLCPHTAKVKIYLKKHLLTHKNADEVDKIYKCDVCSFQTPYQSSLGKHVKMIHAPNKEKWIPCTLCPYQAKDRGFLIRHMLTHKNIDEVQTFKCELCPFETKYKSSIGRHVKNHIVPDESNMHSCKLCSYKGKTPTHLQQHMRSHKTPGDTKMYKCKKCPYQSIHSANIVRHNLIHRNCEKMIFFPCDKCEFQAMSDKLLKMHCDKVHKS